MYKTQVFPQQPEIIACHVTKVLRILKLPKITGNVVMIKLAQFYRSNDLFSTPARHSILNLIQVCE